MPTWIEEDLTDLLILGQDLTELPSLQEFRQLMTRREVPIYPCIFAYGNGYPVSPDEVIRASAANLWRDGADGLYTFNWFFYGPWRRQTLEEIADPKRLSSKDKNYILVQRFEPTPREPGADYLRYNTILKDAPVPFNMKIGEGARQIAIPVADLPSRPADVLRSAELWIGFDYLAEGDLMEVKLNGHPLGEPATALSRRVEKVGYQLTVPAGNGLHWLPCPGISGHEIRGCPLAGSP